MRPRDKFDMWACDPYVPSIHFESLDQKCMAYWAGCSRWPLLAAIFLSMGLNPHARLKLSGKLSALPTPEEGHITEFFSRIKLAHAACEDGSLVADMVPAPRTGYGSPTVDREVDAKSFISWARKNFSYNCEEIFELALTSHKSTAHAESGSKKGKQADEVKKKITEMAIAELNSGCKCHHSELAEYLYKLRNANGEPAFKLPGIKETRWLDHFIEATTVAFREKGIPLRNEVKIEPRGRKLCARHPLSQQRR